MRIARLLPFLVMTVLWAGMAALFGEVTYNDARESGSTVGATWTWLGLGVAVAVLLFALLGRQVWAWGQGSRETIRGYPIVLGATVVIGGTTIITGASFASSHGAWRLGVIGFAGAAPVVFSAVFCWLLLKLPRQ